MEKDSPDTIIVDTCSLLRREGKRFVRHNAKRQEYSILLPRMVHNELSRFVRKKTKLKNNASHALSVLRGAGIQRMNRTGKFGIADDEIVYYCCRAESAPRYVCTEDKKLRQQIAEANPSVQLLTAAQILSLFSCKK